MFLVDNSLSLRYLKDISFYQGCGSSTGGTNSPSFGLYLQSPYYFGRIASFSLTIYVHLINGTFLIGCGVLKILRSCKSFSRQYPLSKPFKIYSSLVYLSSFPLLDPASPVGPRKLQLGASDSRPPILFPACCDIILAAPDRSMAGSGPYRQPPLQSFSSVSTPFCCSELRYKAGRTQRNGGFRGWP